MDLHKLPKDILIEIIKKTFDFSKLSVDEIETLYAPLYYKFNQKCFDEKSKNKKLMAQEYTIGNITIKMNEHRIKIGNIFIIRLHYEKKYEYNLYYRSPEIYTTDDELSSRISVILKANTSDTEICEVINTIKSLIQAFRNTCKIQDIMCKYFPK